MKQLLLFIALFSFSLMGCATVTMTTTCPTSSTGVSFALAGSTVGNQAISMLSSLGSAGGLMAAREGATAAPPPTSATMTYRYLPIFGADSGSLSCTQPPTPTTIITSPPASIVR